MTALIIAAAVVVALIAACVGRDLADERRRRRINAAARARQARVDMGEDPVRVSRNTSAIWIYGRGER